MPFLMDLRSQRFARYSTPLSGRKGEDETSYLIKRLLDLRDRNLYAVSPGFTAIPPRYIIFTKDKRILTVVFTTNSM